MLNSFLSGEKKNKKKPLPLVETETRVKKKDIKIPVQESVSKQITTNARNEGKTVTQYCTDILLKAMAWTPNAMFPPTHYQTSQYMVHLDVPENYHKEIIRLSGEWKCSIREAAHRIFVTGAKIYEIL